MDLTLVVMAAGMGSRFGGLKQVAAVGPNGEAIVDFSVLDAKKAGFSKVVFVIKHSIEKEFKDTVGKRVESCCRSNTRFRRPICCQKASACRLKGQSHGAQDMRCFAVRIR